MDINCTDQEVQILEKIALAAEELNIPCYVIGGFVRDKLLGRETKDIDIVCIGNGIELAQRSAARFKPVPTVNF